MSDVVPTAESKPHRAWITLGSNIDPGLHLPASVRELNFLGDVLKVSSVYESEPVGFLDQPRFCNAAILLATSLSPRALKTRLRTVESRLGRVRDPQNKNAPRTIDLDIAFFDDLVIESADLVIPDPEIASRSFLAVPLAEIAPSFLHPVMLRPLREIARTSKATSRLTLREDIRLLWTESETGRARGD